MAGSLKFRFYELKIGRGRVRVPLAKASEYSVRMAMKDTVGQLLGLEVCRGYAKPRRYSITVMRYPTGYLMTRDRTEPAWTLHHAVRESIFASHFSLHGTPLTRRGTSLLSAELSGITMGALLNVEHDRLFLRQLGAMCQRVCADRIRAMVAGYYAHK